MCLAFSEHDIGIERLRAPAHFLGKRHIGVVALLAEGTFCQGLAHSAARLMRMRAVTEAARTGRIGNLWKDL